MRIAMIGAGTTGSTLAELLIRAGHEVTLCHKGAPAELRDLVARLGEQAHAATLEDAAREGELAVLAIPFGAYRELPPEPFARKIVVDATNYHPERDGRFAELDEGQLTSSELIARTSPTRGW
jgi:predicted dinucleotide-binding enzyme